MLIGGCAFYQTERTKIWLICYEDDARLPNGMYENNQLKIRCNGRTQLQFTHKIGNLPTDNKLEDGLKEYIKKNQ